jgi:hypothetical protein
LDLYVTADEVSSSGCGGPYVMTMSVLRAGFLLLATSLAAQQPASVYGQDAVVRVAAPAAWPPDGGSFEVRVEAEGVTALAAFELKLAFDPSILIYEGVEVGPFLGSTSRSVSCLEPDFFTRQRDIFFFACSTAGPEPLGPSGAGVLATVRFRPGGRGPSPLALSDVKLTNTEGQPVPASVQGSSISIGKSAGTPVPTATPVGTSPEPQGLTATPAAVASTPTPVPPGYEVQPLLPGCNLMIAFADGAGVEAIATAVAPWGILESLWGFREGAWLGYSPRYPEVSDLAEIDFGQALFICTSAPGQFLRPAA